MDFTRTRGMDWLAAGGGLLLLVSLLLPWYSVKGFGINGWESLSVIDVVLALTSLLAIAVAFVTAGRDAPAVPLVVTVVAATFTVVAALLVVIRVIWTPSLLPEGFVGAIPGGGTLDLAVSRDVGLWVALVAVVVTTGGCWRALADERAPSLRPAPEPERQPTPPAQATG